MASTRPPGTYSPSARTGRRGGGSGGVAGTVRRAGSDALPTVPVDSWATSIRRWSRPDTAFRFRGCFDMGNPLQHNPGLADPDGPGAPTDPGFSIRSATGRTACACEPQLHVSAHAHQTCTPFRGFSHPYPVTEVAPSSSALSPTPPAFAVACIEKWWRTEGRKRYPDADCLQSPRRQRLQQRLHAARLKVQPAAPGNTGVAGRADERRVPASWSPGAAEATCSKTEGICSNKSDLLAIAGVVAPAGGGRASATALPARLAQDPPRRTSPTRGPWKNGPGPAAAPRRSAPGLRSERPTLARGFPLARRDAPATKLSAPGPRDRPATS